MKFRLCKRSIELADVFAWLCAMATLLKIDLAEEMERAFADGCVKCHLPECDCGYSDAEVK